VLPIKIMQDAVSVPLAYATLDPTYTASGITLSHGNLRTTATATALGISRSSTALTGKKYWEGRWLGVAGFASNALGIATAAHSLTASLAYSNPNGWAIWGGGPGVRHNGVTAISLSESVGVLMFAYDATTGSMWFGRNGAWLSGDPAAGTSPAYTGIASTVYPAVCPWVNPGANELIFDPALQTYAAPSGFGPVTA
jgi:hypothetical protein